MTSGAYLFKVLKILLAAGLLGGIVCGIRAARGQDLPKARTHYEEARKHVDAGKLAEARAELEKALEIVPHYSDALYLLGIVDTRTDRWTEAKECFEHALHVGPEQAMHHYGIGMCHVKLGDAKGAKKSFERARELAVAGREQGRTAVDKALAEVDFQLALLARDAGDDQEEKTLLDRAISEDPTGKNGKLLAEKGALLLRLGDAKGAVLALEKALETAPDELQVVYSLGRALIAAGREEDGKKKLDQYRVLDEARREKLNEQRRHDEAARLAASAEALLKEGKKDEAREQAKKAYGFDPKNDGARRVLEATQ